MYGLLTQDLAKTLVADREREISRLAVERAAADVSGPRLRERLIAGARRLGGWNSPEVVGPSASVVSQ